MVRYASITDDTFEPYHDDVEHYIQGIIDAATNAADFAAFKTAIAAL